MKWNLFDFTILGLLSLMFSLTYGLLKKKVKNSQQRILMAIALVFLFFLVWAEIAVGVFGTPISGS